jgi:anti-anti-sigma regulatory factor
MIFCARLGLFRVSPHTPGPRIVRVDAGEIDADGATLDALARMALAARQCGYRLVVQDASPELADLIELAGLSEALGVEPLRPGSTRPRY